MPKPELRFKRGFALHEQGRLDDAYRVYQEVLRQQPNHFDALHMAGVIALQTGRAERGVELIGRAIRLNGNIAATYNNLGNGLRALKRLEEAVASYDNAIALKPDYASAYYNRGIALRDLQRHADAIASYDRAIALQPDHAEAYYNRGVALEDLARHEEAAASCEKAIAIDPDHRYALGCALGNAQKICDWTRTSKLAADLKDNIINGKRIIAPFALLGQLDDPWLHLQCARRFSQDKVTTRPPPLWTGTVWRHDRIRIAYLSADFREHAVAYQIVGLLESHDRSKFEVLGVSLGAEGRGDMRARLARTMDEFHDVRTKNDLEAATLLSGLEIDIAVDLGGHTGNARPGILAHRPAPIQVSYLGYPGTMGTDFIDYIVADKMVLPFDQQPFFTERVVHLPDCYQVNDAKRRIAQCTPTRREAGLPGQGFVFCCFNNNYKITAPVFEVWMRLLRTTPDSVLWLVHSNSAAERNLRAAAAVRGVDPARLVFADRQPVAEHLARHRLADLFLDTLPYNAHGTASFALWAGLPVLTCQGRAFAGRVAASLLHAVGLAELVTDSLRDYEALAMRLATDAPRLHRLRETLARNRLSHALFDTDRFCRNIESAYTTMWELWQRGERPRSFSVGPRQGAGDERNRQPITGVFPPV